MSLEFCSVCDPRLYVLDMEWLGDVTQPGTTFIYSIAVIHCATGNVFTAVIDPGLSVQQLRAFRVYDGCRKVTRSWLKREKAEKFSTAFKGLCDFVQAHSGLPNAKSVVHPPLLAAHGAHRADKPVLVSAMRRTGVTFPPNWRWVDTLHFFRRVLPPFRTTGYSLYEIAKSLGVNPASFGRPHDALPDAKVLLGCIKVFPHIFGANYGWHETALTTVPGVGLRTETLLFQHNIRSTEHLLTFAVHCCFHSRFSFDRALHRPYSPPEQSATPLPASFAERQALHGLIARGLKRVGVEKAAKVAKWCVNGVCIFQENAGV